MGRVKLSKDLVEERAEEEEGGRWERRWSGSKWPWKKISSAGDKSMAVEGSCGLAAVEEGGWWWWWWREMVKENSWAGEEEEEGGEAMVEGGGDGGGCDLHSISLCILL